MFPLMTISLYSLISHVSEELMLKSKFTQLYAFNDNSSGSKASIVAKIGGEIRKIGLFAQDIKTTSYSRLRAGLINGCRHIAPVGSTVVPFVS